MAEKAKIKVVSREKLAEGVYEATFTNGKVVSWNFGALFPGFQTLPEVAKQTVVYGAKQKCDDSMAGAADVDEAIQELESTIAALDGGKWTLRVAGEGGIEAGGLFARAFSKARGISLADAKVQIADVVKKNMEKNPKASERQVANAIRATLLQNDKPFADAYREMQQEREQKATKKVQIEL